MSRYDLLDENEMAGLTGDGVVVPPGYAVPPVAAIAGATPDPNAAVATATGEAPKVVTDAAGQQVVQTDKLDPSLPTARSGAEAAQNFERDNSHDLLQPGQPEQLTQLLTNYALGKDEPAAAATDPNGVARTGLPTWYRNAKLRGDRIPGSKNSHYVLDEATWEPPKEEKLWKGLAGMLGNMTTAGSQVAVKDENRPLAMRMKDAKRIALGQGATSLAETFLDRKNLRYQDLLKTAKEESEIEKNRAIGAGKGAGGAASAASRMSAAKGALGAYAGGRTADRLEHGHEVETQQALIDNAVGSPKAEKFRQDLIRSSNGYLTDNMVPHASYTDLKLLKGELNARVADAAKADQTRYDAQWKWFHDNHQLGTTAYTVWLNEQKALADRRRDHFLPANMFWKNDLPTKDAKQYEEIQNRIGQTDSILKGVAKLKEIQEELSKLGPLEGGGGVVLSTLGGWLGRDKAQALTLLGMQWANELRDIIREKNKFGVPQHWEQELLRTRILQPGDFMAWLQGTKNFDALYAVVKQTSKDWFRARNVGFVGEDDPGKQWTGAAPPILTDPEVRTKDGKIDPTWERLSRSGELILQEIEKYGHRLTAQERQEKGVPDPMAAGATMYGAELTPPPSSPEATPVKGAAGAPSPKEAVETFKAVGNHMSEATKELFNEVRKMRPEDWTEKVAKEWKARAADIKDAMLSYFANLPFSEQRRQFFEPDQPEPAHPLATPLEVSGPARHKPKPAPKTEEKKQTRWWVTQDGVEIPSDIPEGASPEKAQRTFDKGVQGVPEAERGKYKLEHD